MLDQFCEDEGCPHYGTVHICISESKSSKTCPECGSEVNENGNCCDALAEALRAMDLYQQELR